MAMIVGERDRLGDPEDNEIVKDPNQLVTINEEKLLKAGKRRFVKIVGK